MVVPSLCMWSWKRQGQEIAILESFYISMTRLPIPTQLTWLTYETWRVLIYMAWSVVDKVNIVERCGVSTPGGQSQQSQGNLHFKIIALDWATPHIQHYLCVSIAVCSVGTIDERKSWFVSQYSDDLRVDGSGSTYQLNKTRARSIMKSMADLQFCEHIVPPSDSMHSCPRAVRQISWSIWCTLSERTTYQAAESHEIVSARSQQRRSARSCDEDESVQLSSKTCSSIFRLEAFALLVSEKRDIEMLDVRYVVLTTLCP